MPDPMPTLNKFLNVRRTLPNGGGQFNVANSTPSGVTTPVQAPDAGLMHALANVGGYSGGQETPVPPMTPPAPSSPAPAPTPAPSATPDLESLIKKYSSNDNSRLYGVGGPSSNTGNAPMDFMSLREEQLRDRANGTGLYALPKNTSLTPDQIFGLRSMADNHYSDLIQSATAYSKEQREADKLKSSEITMPSSASNYLTAASDLGLFSGGTEDERLARIKSIAKKTPEEQKKTIESMAINTMPVGQRQEYNNYRAASQIGTNLLKTFPDGATTNPLKFAKENISQYFGAEGDQKYADFKNKLGVMTAPIINNLYGVAVSSGENVRAKTFIPDLQSQSASTVMTAIKNLVAYTNWANDAELASRLSMPIPNVEDYYASATGRPDETTSTSSGSTGSNPDQEALDSGYTQEEINAYKKANGISFNSVGNTKASPVVSGVNISSYATDPQHEVKIASIVNRLGSIDSTDPSSIDTYIRKIAPNSPVTGTMIATAANAYGVDPKLVTAIIQNDSSFGTAGKAVRTNNPGNVGNDDAGNLRTYPSVDQGVLAVAKWLANHKVS